MFHTKQDAEQFRTTIIRQHAKQWRVKHAEKTLPCWVYQNGEYCWEGKVALVELMAMNPAMGTIKHPDGLPPKLEPICRATFYQVGKYTCPTYEQWELGFMSDQNPDKELAVWEAIADAHGRYLIDHPDADPKTVALLLISVSIGAKAPSLAELAAYYRGPIKPVVVEFRHRQEMSQTSN